MRVIICGSRDITDVDLVAQAMAWAAEVGVFPDVVISGTARGADKAGEAWARRNAISVKCYPADWNNQGKGAGYRRNEKMVKNSDATAALWDGQSRGTAHTIEISKRAGHPTIVVGPNYGPVFYNCPEIKDVALTDLLEA